MDRRFVGHALLGLVCLFLSIRSAVGLRAEVTSTSVRTALLENASDRNTEVSQLQRLITTVTFGWIRGSFGSERSKAARLIDVFRSDRECLGLLFSRALPVSSVHRRSSL